MFLAGLSKNEKYAFYALAKSIIAADRVLDDREQLLMGQFLLEMGITEEQIEAMTMEAALDLLEASSSVVKKQLFIELIGLVKCDEVIADSEKDLMDKIARSFCLTEETVQRLQDCVDELMLVYEKINDLVEE